MARSIAVISYIDARQKVCTGYDAKNRSLLKTTHFASVCKQMKSYAIIAISLPEQSVD